MPLPMNIVMRTTIPLLSTFSWNSLKHELEIPEIAPITHNYEWHSCACNTSNSFHIWKSYFEFETNLFKLIICKFALRFSTISTSTQILIIQLFQLRYFTYYLLDAYTSLFATFIFFIIIMYVYCITFGRISLPQLQWHIE